MEAGRRFNWRTDFRKCLPPSAGIPTIRRELTAGATRGEIVVAGRLGLMLEELDETGGLDVEAVGPRGPMLGRVAGMFLHGGLTVETIQAPPPDAP